MRCRLSSGRPGADCIGFGRAEGFTLTGGVDILIC